ncbi:RimK family alpha-L-glutamate ligase [bacterium]|nr:RimK family alpha-L-glutamate ligase [bacterium]
MKIAYITSKPNMKETYRVREEMEALGHSVILINLSDSSFIFNESGVKNTLISKETFDIIIARDVLSYIKHYATLVETYRKRGIKVYDNGLTELKYVINKPVDLMKLASVGVAIPKTFFTKDFGDYRKAAKSFGFPLIFKKTNMGKGVGIYLMKSEEEFAAFLDQEIKDEVKATSYLMQEFIEYEHDLRVLVIGDQMFAMKRIPKEGDFRANYSLGGTVKLFEITPEIKELATKAINAVGMNYGGVDVLIDKSGKLYILEVNHNAGFAGMEEATGKNIGKMYVEHALKSAK